MKPHYDSKTYTDLLGKTVDVLAASGANLKTQRVLWDIAGSPLLKEEQPKKYIVESSNPGGRRKKKKGDRAES